ncbi:DMT family transporter [Pelomonas aquatica]|jgi:drug/metabolite transporter (DMT)-like permease|uniref:DMT family transporter n=1 Tax=Pelomonas aquatica TaxID=431058 RepID=A0A9X4LKX3_9BURK|nr:DMT family transporter [Pelomonas aquatica]MCY4753032.1 DMT family transporter [Pelomonas aquatica]MDG0862028.1 DMT family transporter [Pelomonas aquatica]
MTANTKPGAITALLFATTAWGSLFLIGKPVVARLDPAWFTLLRYTLATALLVLLVQLAGDRPWAKLRRHALRHSLVGLAGYGLFSILVFQGLKLSLPSHGSVIMATMPFTTLALRWALDGRRPPLRAVAGAALALAGVATVAHLIGHAGEVNGRVLLGDAITLAGTLGWVLYTRNAARLPDHSPLEYTALTAVAALPWLALGTVAATLLGLIDAPSPALLLGLAPKLAYIALVPTVAAALAFNAGVRKLGAPMGTLFLNMVPVSVIAVRAVLGEAPHASEIAGAALVGLGLALTVWTPAPARLPQARTAPCAN